MDDRGDVEAGIIASILTLPILYAIPFIVKAYLRLVIFANT